MTVTKTFKQLMLTTALLGMLVGNAGCGCNSDSTLTTLPQAQPAVLGVRSYGPPIPVDPPDTPNVPLRIDVTFVLDDSDSMNKATLGLIPQNGDADQRERTQAAQTIMRSLEQNIAARLKADYLATGVAEEDIPEFDFAFAVVRYEDFGGPFTNPNRTSGDVDADLFGMRSPENDTDARPYILNMPILRQEHPEFEARFVSALARTAPGDGNPRFVSGNTRIAISEPQSGIEALYQIAAPTSGDGVAGGFDADGNGNTLGSGAPTSLDPARNPQTIPGSTGDVPAVAFLKSDEADPDGQDLFFVADEDKNIVETVDPNGGDAPVPTIASGDLGGVGWRRDAARFVILASDIATVAPTETAPLGDPEEQATIPGPADSETVSSQDGSATPTGDPQDAPRNAATALLGAFDSGFELIGGSTIPRRIGVAEGPTHEGMNGVAPVGAHTVQQTIDRLNELDIEVLLIGAPFAGGLDTKPGATGVNGDDEADISSADYDPTDPAKVIPDRAPWFWFNAVNLLTMPRITSVLTDPDDAFDDSDVPFPAVYNLATVWPLDITDPQGSDPAKTAASLRNTVTDDLVERIRDWADNGYLDEESQGEPEERPDPMPTLDFFVQLDLDLPADADVILVSPQEINGDPKTHFEGTVEIPVYFADEAEPDRIEIDWPALSFVAKDDTVPLPASILVPFTMTAELAAIGNQTPENQGYVDAIVAYLKARGNGTDYDVMGNPVPFADEKDGFVQAEGVLLVTVRPPGDNGPTAQILTFAKGLFILNDLAPGRDNSDQIGGSGLSFPPPPPSDG